MHCENKKVETKKKDSLFVFVMKAYMPFLHLEKKSSFLEIELNEVRICEPEIIKKK